MGEQKRDLDGRLPEPRRPPEFGHVHGGTSLMAGGFWDGWGVGPFVIVAGDKSYRFEDSDRFGPSRVNADGEIARNPFFGERSPFWHAWRCWKRGGRQVNDEGVCLWTEAEVEEALGLLSHKDHPNV
jgi:hypothetical protein